MIRERVKILVIAAGGIANGKGGAAAKYTTLSRAFTGRLGRGITSRIAEDLRFKEKDFLPFPLQTAFISHLRKAALANEKWDMVWFWGGQIAPVLKHKKASELMKSILEERNNNT